MLYLTSTETDSGRGQPSGSGMAELDIVGATLTNFRPLVTKITTRNCSITPQTPG